MALEPRRPSGPRPPDADEILAGALSAYSDVEPPPGAVEQWAAEARRAEALRLESPLQLPWRRMALAFAAGVIVAGVVFLSSHTGLNRPAAGRLTAVAPARVTAPTPTPMQAAAERAVRRVAGVRRAAAWQPFPLPRPATAQEQLVLQLLDAPPPASPPPVVSEVVVTQSPPTMFAAVEIPPVSIPLIDNAPAITAASAVKAAAGAESGNNNND